jgi:hypothetical protein
MKKRIVAIKKFDQLIVDPDFCPHENTVRQSSGGYHFGEGGASDDIKESILCLDCMQQVLEDAARPEADDEIPY